jgi:hypothetical protein
VACESNQNQKHYAIASVASIAWPSGQDEDTQDSIDTGSLHPSSTRKQPARKAQSVDKPAPNKTQLQY